MTEQTLIDVIVIGGGVVGLAAAYAAARRGQRTVLLERRSFFHDETASSGLSRQFRLQYDDPTISRLVQEAMPLWRELEEQGGEKLNHQVGCLWFGDPAAPGAEGQIDNVLRTMADLGIPFDRLTAGEITEQYGFTGIPESWTGFFQPDGAATNVKATLKALYRAGVTAGVEMRSGTAVRDIAAHGDGVRITTEAGELIDGRKLIIAAGPETNSLLRVLGIELRTTVWEMVSACFAVRPGGAGSEPLPTWIDFQQSAHDDPGLYYGFPELPWERGGHMRIGANYPSRVMADGAISRTRPDPATVTRLSEWVAQHMPGLDPAPVDPTTCVCSLFTDPAQPQTLSRQLLLDFLPDVVPAADDVVVCATGWVFKIAPLLGSICVDLAVDGTTTHDISGARLKREQWRLVRAEAGV
ncbi:hypothetical protein SD37_10515 [Amycolatopsis orientalis]|uniref:FAD dependent oxidoreductase domain-containing protein n=1 Tax=Amycolatopsis orientalis TaxID=31958 RepID=A0A193BV32_AMYOR|nr:FAD-dependent oxidoreductase [Amycolatopsis orientalis]ANN16029.1 hypothetical protein SD37_10515 [Amycolatopsis orientalis]